MLSEFDKQRLQAGFDGELEPGEWQRLREALADSPEAAAYLAELEALQAKLEAAPEVAVPAGLAEAIKRQIPPAGNGRNVTRVDFAAGAAGRERSPRLAVNLRGGLALAASLVLAVGLGVQFLGVSELGMDSDLRSRMTGTLLEPGAKDSRQQWQWQGMAARAVLFRNDNGLTLDLEVDAGPAADLVLDVSGDQWRWRQDAASAAFSNATGGRLQLAVKGEQRYRLELEPATTDGESAQGIPPVPRISIAVQRLGELPSQGTIVPD